MSEGNDKSEELRDDVQEFFKMKLESAEELDRMVNENNLVEFNEALLDVVESMLQNVKDTRREKRIYMTVGQIGEALGYKEMRQFAKEGLTRLSQGGGDE